MLAQYTETLETLLENKKYGIEGEEDTSLSEVLELLRKFPNFVFGEDLNISMEKLFIDKYDIREIGAETEELFLHFWREKTQELLIKYVPKIKMWLDNFNDLFKFTVQLTIQDNKNYQDNTQNTYYLNPVSSNTENLKVQDVDKTGVSGNSGRTITRDTLQTVWGKTRADILSKIFEVKSVYMDCLNEFETIFMGLF